MSKNKLLILLILRILLCALFVFSGISKLYPVWGFEKQLVDLGFASWCDQVSYLSRAIIALEIFLGLAFLQSHYLKRFVIPATFIVLVIFCIHLTVEIFTKGANSGNCGCFGQWISMTPLEALIKNLLTLGMLAYMYSIYKEKEKNQYLVLVVLYLVSNLAIFLAYPFCPCSEKPAADESALPSMPIVVPDSSAAAIDSPKVHTSPLLPSPAANQTNSFPTKKANADTVKVQESAPPLPPKKTSEFTAFRKFSDGSVVDLDDGKKIVTLFSLECEHCMETAKKIGELAKRKKLPPVYILFWGEESQVENFFTVAQCRYPYKIVEPQVFFPLLGKAPAPPRVVFMHQGNVMADWDFNTFSIEKLEQQLNAQ
ncbi:MAG: hypothetical protein MUF42_02845 [Cytophagaceae bacterium]|jgi:uncharacterized membrane protein YphA (DoxX/SURF4 family)|nr:hypothetical protein [Cytophagaceae bacterium]